MVHVPAGGGSASTSKVLINDVGKGVGAATSANNGLVSGSHSIPLGARRAPPLDMSTVERRGHPSASKEVVKKSRPHGLSEAPIYRPTEEEFRDPFEYIKKIAPEGRKYGIVKIIPPDNWNPDFAIDTQRFHFRTRRQELNSVEGGTRANLNYLDQLAKYHKQHGTNLNRFPSVDKRPLDLYRLKKAVESRGGFERVCKGKKWAEIGRDLGYSGKIMSSLSTSLKNSYQKWLFPYEQYIRVAKPGVQQQLEFENGGPYTPSPGPSPMRQADQLAPSSAQRDSPAIRASSALQATIKPDEDGDDQLTTSERPRPIMTSGFTPVNAGGFTAVNARPMVSSFSPVNKINGLHQELEDGLSATGSSPETAAFKSNDGAVNPVVDGIALRTSRGTKRQMSDEGDMGESDGSGRRSKRLRKDAPTVAGSHMTQPRHSMPRPFPPRDRKAEKPGEVCETCGKADDPASILLCDSCDSGYHKHCLEPPLKAIPDYDWHCPRCLVGTGEFGFEEGGIYSLKQFQEKASAFKSNYFAPRMPFDPVINAPKPVSEDDVEREFWRLVESLTETVEVEYGADIHSTTHGSGFPTIERNPRDPYSTDPWNLNILPLDKESLFRHINSDISGMTVPWLYVGMCFSTFCWHNEDHYTYSANYQHFGATKTWYGIPEEDADKFEGAMREAVPELFETQPDLLFQLVTLLPPEQLKRAGVRVYALDQRAGQFVITFPRAYHAGFNHGFNLNEAVNFAPADWEPFGELGVMRLQEFRRQPCFSHDELLLTAANRDATIKTAKWLAPALDRLREREMTLRRNFPHMFQDACKDGLYSDRPVPELSYHHDERDVPEEEYVCAYCKSYSYLSRFECGKSSKVACLAHAGSIECCSFQEEKNSGAPSHKVIFRVTDEALETTVKKVIDRANMPEVWAGKLNSLIDNEPRPSLKALRSLLSEGERIPFELDGLSGLKRFVDRCNEWVEEATNYITRKQQNRRKNEKVWRKGNASKAAELEERDRELRKVDNIYRLLAKADEISFDCPEIDTLREKAESIAEFQRVARLSLSNLAVPTARIESLIEEGRSFNVDLPEVEKLDAVVQKMKWDDEALERRRTFQTLQGVTDFLTQGLALGVHNTNKHLLYFRDQKERGEFWESKAKELMAAENVHYQQLDALSQQAASLPVSKETLAAVDAILKKQREVQDQIIALYERSKHKDFRQRPNYQEVRQVMSTLADLNTKPAGTPDLEKEQKRHEGWMRKGKKLFGKANAPLHILLAHMQMVDERNKACFEINDLPRKPVEPSSREHTPDEPQGVDGSSSIRDVFCICRRPEAGMMIECEICHEWYHGKCLKIARGKVKEDEKYTCPICDWRDKIPRDAARPKLEDLQAWQDEMPSLPFQPEEEEVLASIVNKAQTFRDYIRPWTLPLNSTPEEITTQRFYLRKIEGADILLSYETNFFRQELHRWAPVAPEAPPIREESLSNRKPRPTKQQKLMAQLGVNTPEDLPQHLRTKPHNFNKRKHMSHSHDQKPPPLQPAPGRPLTSASLSRAISAGDPASNYPNPVMSHHQLTPSFSYDNPQSNPSYQGSPMFSNSSYGRQAASYRSPSFGSASPHAAIDPSLFNPPPFGRTIGSPLHHSYGSNQSANVDPIFNDLANHEGLLGRPQDHHTSRLGHSGMEGGRTPEVDPQALADEFLNS